MFNHLETIQPSVDRKVHMQEGERSHALFRVRFRFTFYNFRQMLQHRQLRLQDHGDLSDSLNHLTKTTVIILTMCIAANRRTEQIVWQVTWSNAVNCENFFAREISVWFVVYSPQNNALTGLLRHGENRKRHDLTMHRIGPSLKRGPEQSSFYYLITYLSICCCYRRRFKRSKFTARLYSLHQNWQHFSKFLRLNDSFVGPNYLSLIHIWRCRRSTLCRSRWSPYH